MDSLFTSFYNLNNSVEDFKKEVAGMSANIVDLQNQINYLHETSQNLQAEIFSLDNKISLMSLPHWIFPPPQSDPPYIKLLLSSICHLL